MSLRSFITGITMVTLLATAASARAQETLDDIEKMKGQSESPLEKKATAEVNGYVYSRFQGGYIDPNLAPISSRDIPSIQLILEGNIQLKVHLGAKAFVYADLSVIYQNGWLFYQKNAMGEVERAPDHDVPSLRPFVVPAELYVTYSPKPWINFLVGKKRIIWGPGFAFNPTDLINPPKDPTDPNFQRAGQWVARIELPFEKFTISTLFAPQVLYQTSGIPFAVMKYPDYPLADALPTATSVADDKYHYLIAARLYLLLFDSDINFFYFFSNKYNNAFENASRFGGSFSRYFFTDYELHLEALFQFGSARFYPNHHCATAGLLDNGCNATQALTTSKLTDGNVYPRLLVGGRTMFRDESTLSIEYYYQADGYSDLEFEDTVRLIAQAGAAANASMGTGSSGGTSGALPQRFTFDPLRRHYLILSFTKPKIRDDFTISAVLIAGLADLSGTFSPSVAWQAKEWLTLSLYGFVPIRGIPVGTVQIGENNYSEYSLSPLAFRLVFEARAYY